MGYNVVILFEMSIKTQKEKRKRKATMKFKVSTTEQGGKSKKINK